MTARINNRKPRIAFQWPEHVTDTEWDMLNDHLSEEELRTFAAVCGEPVDSQPKDRDDLVNLVIECISRDTVMAQHAYVVICRKALPKGYKPAYTAFTDERFQSDVLRLLDMTRQARELSDEIKDQMVSETVEACRKFNNELIETTRKAVEKVVADSKPRVVQITVGNYKATVDGEVLHPAFDRAVALVAAGVHVALVGPAGCGKTHLAEQIAKSLKRAFAAQSMSAGVSESAFTGWLLPMGKGGEYVHVPTPFLEVYEKGGVFLFDEMDNADPNLLVFMNMALANKSFYLPTRKGNPVVTRHKDFVAVGCMNTFGTGADAQYVGRAQLDGATLDRFRAGMIYMDYDAALEQKLVDPTLYASCTAVRKVINEKRLQRILSTRFMLDGTKMMRAAGWTVKQVLEGFFADWSADERRLVAHLNV